MKADLVASLVSILQDMYITVSIVHKNEIFPEDVSTKLIEEVENFTNNMYELLTKDKK